MKIQVEREILDDEEFCSKIPRISTDDGCPNLFVCECKAFVNKNQDPIRLKYNRAKNRYNKCDQCKEAWKKAKEATIIDINEQWGVSPHQQ